MHTDRQMDTDTHIHPYMVYKITNKETTQPKKHTHTRNIQIYIFDSNPRYLNNKGNYYFEFIVGQTHCHQFLAHILHLNYTIRCLTVVKSFHNKQIQGCPPKKRKITTNQSITRSRPNKVSTHVQTNYSISL